jgi:predicted secreted protein
MSKIITLAQGALSLGKVCDNGGIMRSVAKFSCAAVLILLSLGVGFAGEEKGADKMTRLTVTREMVWNTDRQTVQTAKQRCSEAGGRQLEECFADAMESLGAPSEAVSFTRSFGSGVFVRRFREAGRVDVAYIMHPFRMNGVAGVLLVNGDPPIIDVDDIALLPREGMEQDKIYAGIKKLYPKVTIWPGDRSPKYPFLEIGQDGAQTFVVPYTLRNFCHSCEVLGTVFFSFDFDNEGRLSGIRFLRTEPAPRKPSTIKGESRRENEQIRFIVMTEEGKEFTVRLGANRTTGYQWRPANPIDERFVKLVRSEYTPFDANQVGGGGEETWTFLGTGRGDTEITMEYVRPWEKNQPAVKTATIKVSVRAATSR